MNKGFKMMYNLILYGISYIYVFIGFSIIIFILYLIGEFLWEIPNVQLCTSNLPKNPTCEQIAENNLRNCRYIIKRWKKVDYNLELKKCQD